MAEDKLRRDAEDKLECDAPQAEKPRTLVESLTELDLFPKHPGPARVDALAFQ